MHLFYSLPTLPAASIRALCCAPGALLKVVTFMNCLLCAPLAASTAQPSVTAKEKEPGEEKQLTPNALINSQGEITVQHYPNPLVLLMEGRQYFCPINLLSFTYWLKWKMLHVGQFYLPRYYNSCKILNHVIWFTGLPVAEIHSRRTNKQCGSLSTRSLPWKKGYSASVVIFCSGWYSWPKPVLRTSTAQAFVCFVVFSKPQSINRLLKHGTWCY